MVIGRSLLDPVGSLGGTKGFPESQVTKNIRDLDKMVNLETAKKFSGLIKNSTTHVIKGCGHMIMIEKAFEMREKILEFLNS